MGMDIRVLDSLQKVFADEELPAGGTAGADPPCEGNG